MSRASGYVPETLSNIRTIHALGKEEYMERRYDEAIEAGYRAMEKTNFYDAIYSPVILIVNAVVVAAVMLVLTLLNFGGESPAERSLRITIPENLDYDGLFDDLFRQYTSDYTLEKVKTANMGTLYELQYRVTLKTPEVPKAFLDEIRCRNGNLNVTCGREVSRETL